MSWSANAQGIITELTETQATQAQAIARLADEQATPLQTACSELLATIIANTETSSSSNQATQPTGTPAPGGEGGSSSTSSSSSSSKSLMFKLLDWNDEGRGLGIVINGEIVCAVVQVDTGDPNLEGEVSWGRVEPETEEQ